MCHGHRARYIKCNGLYKLEYYRDIVWCCKTNFMINMPRLKIKKSKPCSHSFKCVNCKNKYQANSNIYPITK